jgi:uncharacterized membrane protein
MHLFEISPNCSLTPRQAVVFYLSIAGVTLVIGLAFAAAGLWPVLPFVGLELALLGYGLRVVQRRAREREWIRVDERDVLVRQQRGRAVREHRFARPWTRVELRAPRAPTWPSRLLLASQGRSVEVGACLTEGERHGLRRRLAEVLEAR